MRDSLANTIDAQTRGDPASRRNGEPKCPTASVCAKIIWRK